MSATARVKLEDKMHRIAWGILGALLSVNVLFVGTAFAQNDYTRHVGTTPAVGATDTGSGSSSGGAEVLGEHFVRGPNGEILAFGGADIAEMAGVGLLAIGVGTVLVRRSRSRRTVGFGSQPAV
jgi:hypothetical protein